MKSLKVVQGGASLAFISYPTAVLEMDLPPFWSFLFFFMLICLALSSVCGGVQVPERIANTKIRTILVQNSCAYIRQHCTISATANEKAAKL